MLISCIIPTRNRPEYVLQSAASVLAQTYANIELIIVNDGSVTVPSFADTRVRILDSGQAGAVPARNLGVAHARGEAIAWLDDDDAWSDNTFLETCAGEFAKGSAFLFGDGALVFPDGQRKAFARDANLASLKLDNTILISSVCYRTHLHRALGIFDTALPYYWDWDWYFRVAVAGHELGRIARPVVDIRIHENNMSGQANAKARSENLHRFSTKHLLRDIPLKSHIDFV